MFSLKKLGQRSGFFPGVLSFSLPGLGQLYQRRFVVAGCGLIPFWTVLALQPGTVWPLLFAFGFGAEAFLFGEKHGEGIPTDPGARRRRQAYGATGVIAFCFWIMMAAPAAGLLRRQAEATGRAEGLAAFVRDCARKKGSRPTSFDDCVSEGRPRRSDPWGRDFEMIPTERGFDLRSPGSDGRAGTSDDLVYRYRFP